MGNDTNFKCDNHSGLTTDIKNIQSKQSQRDVVVDKIFDSISVLERNKLSLRLFVPLAVAMLAFVGVLFGLVYESQQQLLEDIHSVKTATKVIEERIK